MVSNGTGNTAAYALNMLEERGVLFIGAQTPVYEGMIIGENAKPGDLDVNPMKSKALTNFRVSGKEDAIRLTTPKVMTLEQAIAYIGLRKRYLDPNDRKKASRQAAAA